MTNKEAVRLETLRKRNLLEPEYRAAASMVIAEKFMRTWGDHQTYGLYSPIRSEVDTGYLIRTLNENGKKILLPKVQGDELHWGSCDNMAEGFCSVMEPVSADRLSQFDIIAIPCVAFDSDCNRIGYGKGCYDRFLSSVSAKAVVILAFDVQKTVTAYPEPHDIAADAVVTENEIYLKLK